MAERAFDTRAAVPPSTTSTPRPPPSIIVLSSDVLVSSATERAFDTRAAVPPSTTSPSIIVLSSDALVSSDTATSRRRSVALVPPPLRPGASIVGSIRFGPEILGRGSGGTLVFGGEQVFNGRVARPVAVKRLLRQFAAAAAAEVSALAKADEHLNIVRFFALEEDEQFVYLALERCERSVADLFELPEGRASLLREVASPSPSAAAGAATSLPSSSSSSVLFRPSPFAMSLAEGATRGLKALHSRGIVHGDLKPANVLVGGGGGDDGTGRVAKLSGMSLCNSTEPIAAAAAAAERSTSARLGEGADLRALGLFLAQLLTGGAHYPAGLHYLRGLAHLPEARHVVAALLTRSPRARPPAAAVLAHPLFWPRERKLKFLVALSDRLNPGNREASAKARGRAALAALDEAAAAALHPGGPSLGAPLSPAAELGSLEPLPWALRVHPDLRAAPSHVPRYDGRSVRDLLRLVRNKDSHFWGLPSRAQAAVGAPPEAFFSYFEERFPRLVLVCWGVALEHLVFPRLSAPASQPARNDSSTAAAAATAASEEPGLAPFFPPEARAWLPTLGVAAAVEAPPPPQQQQSRPVHPPPTPPPTTRQKRRRQ